MPSKDPMRDTLPPVVALLNTVVVAVACSPDDAAPSGGDIAADDSAVDAAVDPVRARAARIRAAAHSVCGKICACATLTDESTGLRYCYSLTMNCCGGYGTAYIDATACELTFMDRLEAANAACEANGPGDCACQGLEHCLAWAESTTCDSNAVPEAAVLFVPQSCYGHGPGPDDACCDDPPEGECPWVPSE
jgi:hypothetical protein